MAEDLAFPNGMAVTADGRTLVVADSYRHQLVGFDDRRRRLAVRTAGSGPTSATTTPTASASTPTAPPGTPTCPTSVCVRVAEGGEVLDTVDLDRGGFACMLGGGDRPGALRRRGGVARRGRTDDPHRVGRPGPAEAGRGPRRRLAGTLSRPIRARLPRPRPPPPLPTGVAATRHRRRVVLVTLLVPQGMAYAELAGLPPITGLYTTAVALLAYALFGPSRVLVLGPDSSLGAGDRRDHLAVAPAEQHPAGRSPTPRCWRCSSAHSPMVAGLLRFGFVADLLSRPTQLGYMNGLALTILVSQLPKLCGFSVDADGLLPEATAFVRGVADGDVVARGGRPRRGLPGTHPAGPTLGADGPGRAGGRDPVDRRGAGCSTSPATASTWSGRCRRVSRR